MTAGPARVTASPVRTAEVAIASGNSTLQGNLTVPSPACGIVVFAHGSGSGRFSRRNRQVARFLNRAGLATLLLDLLTADENVRDRITAEYRFDIPRLARRLTDAVDWLHQERAAADLPIGLFGASTGAAAALITAAERPRRTDAVVSRGGRVDLAGDALPRVRAPTLLIVGGWDAEVIALNRAAAMRLGCEYHIAIVPDAGHLFEEPGTLEEVAGMAAVWFVKHLGPSALARNGPGRAPPD